MLAVVGARLERLACAGHTLAVYLLAGVAGSLAFVATAGPTGYDEASVGASAAFLGLVGTLAAGPRETWGAGLPLDKVVAGGSSWSRSPPPFWTSATG